MRNADAFYRCRFTLPQHTHTLFLAMNYEHFGREGVQIAQFQLKFVISLLVVEQ